MEAKHSHRWSKEYQRIFLSKLAKRYNIKTPSDWGKIKISSIKEDGGKTLINKHNWSFSRALRNLYSGSLLVSLHDLQILTGKWNGFIAFLEIIG